MNTFSNAVKCEDMFTSWQLSAIDINDIKLRLSDVCERYLDWLVLVAVYIYNVIATDVQYQTTP